MFSKLPQFSIKTMPWNYRPFVREVSASILECTHNIELDQPCKIRTGKIIMNQNISNPSYFPLSIFDITPNQSSLTYMIILSSLLHYLSWHFTPETPWKFRRLHWSLSGWTTPGRSRGLVQCGELRSALRFGTTSQKGPWCPRSPPVRSAWFGEGKGTTFGEFPRRWFFGDGEAVAEWKII